MLTMKGGSWGMGSCVCVWKVVHMVAKESEVWWEQEVTEGRQLANTKHLRFMCSSLEQ